MHAWIAALEQFNRDTSLLVLDQAWWSAHSLGMLWPEMDEAFVMSGGGNGGPSAATRRPVVSGLQTPQRVADPSQ